MMKGTVVCYLACYLGAAAVLAETVIINSEVDAALAAYSLRARQQKTDYVKANDFEGLGVVAKGITLGDTSTMTRVGDATVDRNGGTDLFRMSMTMKTFRALVESFTIRGRTIEVIFDVGTNVFSMEARVVRSPGSCYTSWNFFRLDEIDSVTMVTTDPEYDGLDVTDVFRTGILPGVNRLYESQEFLDYMGKNVNLCIE